eukprot:14582723-Alexandrium_andersonii.AAC.1
MRFSVLSASCVALRSAAYARVRTEEVRPALCCVSSRMQNGNTMRLPVKYDTLVCFLRTPALCCIRSSTQNGSPM